MGTTPELQPAKPYSDFIAYVRHLAKDNGNSARLRRSLRKDATITADAMWLLGTWLPADNHDRALVMARVAAWCAAYGPRDSDSDQSRTISGTMRRAVESKTISETVVERTLEAIFREGMETSYRLGHVTRVLEVVSAQRLDWALLTTDLTNLAKGGWRARNVRARWYHDYYNVRNFADKPTETGTGPERNTDHD